MDAVAAGLTSRSAWHWNPRIGVRVRVRRLTTPIRVPAVWLCRYPPCPLCRAKRACPTVPVLEGRRDIRLDEMQDQTIFKARVRAGFRSNDKSE